MKNYNQIDHENHLTNQVKLQRKEKQQNLKLLNIDEIVFVAQMKFQFLRKRSQYYLRKSIIFS